MLSKLVIRRPGLAVRTRLLGPGAVAAACALVAVLGAGSDALASNTARHPRSHPAAATTTIKACYQKGQPLATMKRVASTAACPSGYTSLTWNQQGPAGPQGKTGAQGKTGSQGATGPQGPAGVSAGVSGTSSTAGSLTTSPTFGSVLATAPVPTSGTYYVNASVLVSVAAGDTVACVLADNSGTHIGPFAIVGPAPSSIDDTLPLTFALPLSAGQSAVAFCADSTSGSATTFNDGSITATLISQAAGSTPRNGTASHRIKLSAPPAARHAW